MTEHGPLLKTCEGPSAEEHIHAGLWFQPLRSEGLAAHAEMGLVTT